MSEALSITLPAELVDAIAERVAELMLERQPRAATASPYLTVPEAAEYLRAKPQRVYDLLSAGRLSRFKDGARVLVSRAELDTYLASASARRVATGLPPDRRRRSLRAVDG